MFVFRGDVVMTIEEKQALDELQDKIVNFNDNYEELISLNNKCSTTRVAMDKNEGACYNLRTTFC